jgi:hypothetical protein
VAFRPLSGVPNLAALSAAGAAFWLLSCLLLPAFTQALSASLLYFALSISGLIVGVMAKRSPVMHGLLLGVLTAVVVAAFPVIFQGPPLPYTSAFCATLLQHIAGAAIPGLTFCPLGALLGETLVNRRGGF